MAIFSEVTERIAAANALLGTGAGDVAALLRGLGDDDLVRLTENVSQAAERLNSIAAIGAAVIAERSTHKAGQGGVAQRHGHRNTASLLQEITGLSKSAVGQRIRVGAAVLEGAGAADGRGDREAGDLGGARRDGEPVPVPPVWHAPLGEALVKGVISTAQSDAIRRGLGEPPVGAGRGGVRLEGGDGAEGTGQDRGDGARGLDSDDARGADDDAIREAWTAAAEHLITEAAHRTVEELASEARLIRDQLDPEGAERRFLERYEARSFRTWTDADGRYRGSFAFDDEGFALVASIRDAALRPRRGGPRFVDEAEREAARKLVDDPRTNDQLSYDLMLDVLRAGALADAESVHGTRQAGVRVVTVVDGAAGGRRECGDERTGAGVSGAGGRRGGYTEDGIVALPASEIDRRVCDTGALPIMIDRQGNPLDVGREQRLFTTAQRRALVVRDGGCRWRGCDRPASYCEAHHIDPFSTGGRTDVDRGILLCRFHHMQLHHSGSRITRDGKREFVLHDPGGGQTVLEPRVALRYLFADIDPPPPRFRPAA